MLVLKLLNHSIVFVGPTRAQTLFCRHSPAPSTSVVDSGTRTRRLVATLRDDGGNVKIYNGNDNRECVLLSRYFNYLCLGCLDCLRKPRHWINYVFRYIAFSFELSIYITVNIDALLSCYVNEVMLRVMLMYARPEFRLSMHLAAS